MKRAIVIIQGHPDPDPGRFCQALAEAYAEGARDAGREARIVRIADLDVPFLRTQDAFENAPMPPAVAAAVGDLASADHIVIIFPLWLGTMPAMLKAFLEQVMRPGIAFAYRKDALPEKLLAGISARVVVTMGMPAAIYRLFYLAHGVKCLVRGILKFTGVSPVSTTYIGSVGAIPAERRARWLDEMRALGRDAR